MLKSKPNKMYRPVLFILPEEKETIDETPRILVRGHRG